MYHIGEVVMVSDPMVPKKIPAEIIQTRIGADGNAMYLIKTEWGEAWRREDVLSDSVRELINS